MDEIQAALRKRYNHIHPLIFSRSLEKARNNVELFDIIDSIPGSFPLVWDENSRRWKIGDLLQKDFVTKNDKEKL